MARMIRMTPKRALFLVRPGLPARVISQVTVTGPPVGAVTETTSPAVPSSPWTAWPSCSEAVGGRPLVVVFAAGGAVVPGVPNAPVVTVGTGLSPPPVNAGTTRASTITTTAPMSSSPTGCRHHGGGPPGGRGALPAGGGRYPHGCRGAGRSPHCGGGGLGGCCPHGRPPHGCGSGCCGGWGGCCGGCCGGCSTDWTLPPRPPARAGPSGGKPIDCPTTRAPKAAGVWTMDDQREAVGPEPASVPASATGASATGAASAGFTALLAVAVGAAAIGAVEWGGVGIGCLVIGRGLSHHLRVEELEVGR